MQSCNPFRDGRNEYFPFRVNRVNPNDHTISDCNFLTDICNNNSCHCPATLILIEFSYRLQSVPVARARATSTIPLTPQPSTPSVVLARPIPPSLPPFTASYRNINRHSLATHSSLALPQRKLKFNVARPLARSLVHTVRDAS